MLDVKHRRIVDITVRSLLIPSDNDSHGDDNIEERSRAFRQPAASTLYVIVFIILILVCAIIIRIVQDALSARDDSTNTNATGIRSKHEAFSMEVREAAIRAALNKASFSGCSLDEDERYESKEGQKDKNIERDQCVICLQSFESGGTVFEPVREDCQHCFHKTCIFTWLVHHDDCPYCRRDLFHFDNSCEV